MTNFFFNPQFKEESVVRLYDFQNAVGLFPIFVGFFWKILFNDNVQIITLQFNNFFLSSPQIKEESVVRLYDVGRLKADEEDFEDMDDDDDNPDGDDDGKKYLKTRLNLSKLV